MTLPEAFDLITAVMVHRGHPRAYVVEYLWTLFLQSPNKLQAYVSIDPEHFEMAFVHWYETKNEEYANLRHMVESL